MEIKEEITFTNFREEHGLELIRLWRKSFAQAIGIQEDVRAEVVREHLSYLRTYKPETIRTAIEKDRNKIVGFMAKEENTIKDLFIDIDYQRNGLGSRFIRLAKEETIFLTLSTLDLNKGAQKFYELHGFEIVKRGFASREGNRWASSKEELADITYEWRRVKNNNEQSV